MTSNYKLEERTLKAIIKKYTRPINCDTQIKLNIYYKNRKSPNLIIKNNLSNKTNILDKSHIIYKFKCPFGNLSQPYYVGITTQTL